MDYAAFAEQLGLRGLRVERPEQLEPAWNEAVRADRPVVIDAVTDPEEPPLPPHMREKVREPSRATDQQRVIDMLSVIAIDLISSPRK